jgi:hypothetical protein
VRSDLFPGFRRLAFPVFLFRFAGFYVVAVTGRSGDRYGYSDGDCLQQCGRKFHERMFLMTAQDNDSGVIPFHKPGKFPMRVPDFRSRRSYVPVSF